MIERQDAWKRERERKEREREKDREKERKAERQSERDKMRYDYEVREDKFHGNSDNDLMDCSPKQISMIGEIKVYNQISQIDSFTFSKVVYVCVIF